MFYESKFWFLFGPQALHNEIIDVPLLISEIGRDNVLLLLCPISVGEQLSVLLICGPHYLRFDSISPAAGCDFLARLQPG